MVAEKSIIRSIVVILQRNEEGRSGATLVPVKEKSTKTKAFQVEKRANGPVDDDDVREVEASFEESCDIDREQHRSGQRARGTI